MARIALTSAVGLSGAHPGSLCAVDVRGVDGDRHDGPIAVSSPALSAGVGAGTIARGVRKGMLAAHHGIRAPQMLTARELEIVTLAAKHWTSVAISDELLIPVRTVESHLYRAFAKLGARSRDELADLLSAPG